MLDHYTHFIKCFLISTLIMAFAVSASGQHINRSLTSIDTTLEKTGSKPGFRWKDSYLNRFSFDLPRSPLFFIKTDSLKTQIEYTPRNADFEIEERIGPDIQVKVPQALSFNEYSSIQNAMVRHSILRDYERLQDGNSNTSGRGLIPLLKKVPLVDRIFGGKLPEFKPNGSVGVDLRVGTQYNVNPAVPISRWRQPVFDFDQQIAINFNNNAAGGSRGNTFPKNPQDELDDLKRVPQSGGRLGPQNLDPLREKLGVLGNFNTKKTFNFEDKFKLNFKSDPEDILQSLEAGNVSFPLKSQLIPGVENLFGLKAGLRFGKLNLSTVLAQQRSNTESIYINGGAQNRPFEIRCDQYDENRHFFLAHFFREHFEGSLGNLPMVTAGVIITRVEVYVTNRTNNVSDMRNLVGLTDLGEANPSDSLVTLNPLNKGDKMAASNQVNTLGNLLIGADQSFRKGDATNRVLEAKGLKKGIGFEMLRGARRLSDREFDFNPQLGYISLLSPLRNDEVLAVSYEYIYKGQNYKVGELTEDYSARKEDEVIVLKLLKSSSIRNRTNHKMWDLMMKNVYPLGQSQITREGFQLRVVYKDDKTGLDAPNLHEGTKLKDKPLIAVFGLDRLNYNNDIQYDGNFDYIEKVTINEEKGVIIFPKLEPFGSYLETQFSDGEGLLKQKYVYQELYDKTLTDAQQVSTKNKFFITGSIQSNGTDIPLPLGASASSVRVYSGGTELMQGADYLVDSQLGRIRITNQSILASARPIRIDYERPDLFQTQTRRLFGIRADYTLNRYIRFGATLLDLRENTPGLTTRTSVGNEPVNNSLWGLDVSLRREGNGLTRLLDKLPFIQTKEPSAIQLSAEFAQLLPGVNNRKTKGNSMIDDFEASRTINDLTRQPSRWRLGSTPDNFKNNSDPIYGYNFRRAKISAYTIDNSTYLDGSGFGGNNIVPQSLTNGARNNLYERSFVIQDIFPGRSQPVLGQNLPTQILDIAYFPSERGMYNYNSDLTGKGNLKDPKNNFGALMRGITFDADFDNSNVEYLEFWVLDPFKDVVRDGRSENGRGKRNTTGGNLVFHLGDISEDVIPDSRNNYESGFPVAAVSTHLPDTTAWGLTPKSEYITDAFSVDPDSRKKQDIGLDGLPNENEKNFSHIQKFLAAARAKVSDPEAMAEIEKDPSADDFKYFLNEDFREDQFIVERFKNYLGMENNTPTIDRSQTVLESSTATADKEDINQDNTVSDFEGYFEYKIPLDVDNSDAIGPKLLENSKYIVDKVKVQGAPEDNTFWYLFRIPLRVKSDSLAGVPINGINGFKSIRFMRMMMEGWADPVVLRFGALQLVSNQYRTYAQDLNDHSYLDVAEKSEAGLKVTTVSIEENGCDENGNCANLKAGQTPYVVPPGFVRDRDFSQNIGVQRLFNEQSLSLSVESLKDGEKRGVFRNTQLDLNMYKRLQMFIHMESENNDEAGAFIRFGTDLKHNYYEVEIPSLKATTKGTTVPEAIWPGENEIDIPLNEFRKLKIERNNKLSNDTSVFEMPYSKNVDVPGETGSGQNITRKYTIRVVGNPDISNILTIMTGASNPGDGKGQASKFTVWMDELRAHGYNTQSGESAIIAADIKLADIGSVSLSGNISTFGFGGVQNRISSRTREQSQGFGIAATLEMDKFFPAKWGLSIPLYLNYDKQEIIPHFNPLNPDLVLDEVLSDQLTNDTERDAFRDLVIDRSTNKGFNLANVRKVKTNSKAKIHIYDIENFSFSYSKNQIRRSNVLLQEYYALQEKGGLTYQFQPKKIDWKPFEYSKKMLKDRYNWIREFNLSLLPSTVAFKTDFNRGYTKTQYRSADFVTETEPNYLKYFLINRYYDLQWDLSKALSLTYSAEMNAIVDEYAGDREIAKNKKAVRQNFWSFGRPKNYKQSIQATYTLPFDKFFILDWLKADARFTADYQFRANAYDWTEMPKGSGGLKDEYGSEFGNFIDNAREVGIQGNLDLVKLYNKFKYLKFANSPNAKKEQFTRTFGAMDDIIMPTSDAMKTLTRLLMTVRGINFSYLISETTLLPGFRPSPKLFGMASSKNQFAPGLPFVLGRQDRNFYFDADKKGWLSESSIRNDPFTQTREQKFDFNTNLEPFTGFRMQIKGNYSKGDAFQLLYKPEENGGSFKGISPFRNGTFSMSFWSFKTASFFGKHKASKDPETNFQYDIFDKMVKNRQVVLDKLNEIGGFTPADSSYHLNSQDVLIPAFFAAYSGTSVDKLFDRADRRYQRKTDKGKMASRTFNPFLRIPMPNWRIDYTGLEKLPGLKKVFSSIVISHNYTSSYSVGNFTSSLLYSNVDPKSGQSRVGLDINYYPLGYELINESSRLFAPVFIMSSINMEERMSPLIGVNFSTKSNWNGRFEINKERRAELNLSNSQVAEYNSNDFVFGIGWRRNKSQPATSGKDNKKKVLLPNDLNVRLDFTWRDIYAIQRRLDGDAVAISGGNNTIQLKPQVQYQFSKRLNMGFYIEHFRSTPFATPYYSSRTIGGINAKFNLSD